MNRRIFALILIGSQLANMLLSLGVAFIGSRILDIPDWGYYRGLIVYATMLGSILALGLPVSLQIYKHKEKIEDFYARLATYKIFYILLFLVILILNEFLHLISIKVISRHIIIFAFGNVIQSLVIIEHSLLGNRAKVMLATVALPLLINSIFIFSITVKYPIDTILNLQSSTSIILSLFFILIGSRSSVQWSRFSVRMIKEGVRLGFPLSMSLILGVLMMDSDKLIISSLFDENIFGLYVNGTWKIPLIAVVTGSISTAILSDLSKYAENDIESALNLFRRASVYTTVILFPVCIFSIILSKEIIVFLFSQKYIEATNLFVLTVMQLPIRFVFYGPMLIALKQEKFILKRSALDLVINFILSLLLVYPFGIYGPPIGTLLTLYFFTVPFNIHKLKTLAEKRLVDLFPLQIFAKIICIGVMSVLIIVGIKYFYPLHLLLSSFLFGVSNIFLLWTFDILLIRRFRIILNTNNV